MGGRQTQFAQGSDCIEADDQTPLHVKDARPRSDGRAAGSIPLNAEGTLFYFAEGPDGVHVTQDQDLAVAITPRDAQVIAKSRLGQTLNAGIDCLECLGKELSYDVDSPALIAR